MTDKITWRSEIRKLSDLIEWGKNPRILTEKGIADLKKSIDKFGCAQPLIINTDNIICGGHGRKKVLHELGINEVERLVGGGNVDMVFTDPPYNLNYDFADNGMVQSGQRKAKHGKIQNDSMPEEDFEKFITDVFGNILSFLKDGGSYYISSGRESTQVFNKALKTLDFHIQSWLIWVKSHFNISRLDYHPRHEIITYGWKKGQSHSWFSDRKQSDIIELPHDKKTESVHPTQKPIALIGYFIQNSSQKGARILDLFGGSGSTLIACEQLKREALIMELDEKYCQVIIERYIKFKKGEDKDVYLLIDDTETEFKTIKAQRENAN